jgi:hypothetical protein
MSDKVSNDLTVGKGIDNLIKAGPSNDSGGSRGDDAREAVTAPPGTEDKAFDSSVFDRMKGLPVIEQVKEKVAEVQKTGEADKTLDKKVEIKEDGISQTNANKTSTDENSKKSLPSVQNNDQVVDGVKPLKKSEARDYSGLEEAEAELLKKMSNEAFDYVKPRLVEAKTLKTQLKEKEDALAKSAAKQVVSVLDHEQGFILDPEYQQLNASVSTIRREKAYLEQQLINIKQDKPWKRAIPDGKGNYTFKDEPASAENELEVSGMLRQAENIISQYEQRAYHIQGTYTQRRNERLAAVKGQEDFLFPDYKDPKIFETDQTLKSIKEFMVKSGFGQNELLSAFCKMYKHTMETSQENAELRKGGQVKQVAAEVKQNNGPSNAELNTGAGATTTVKSIDEMPFDRDVFNRMKEGR